MTPIPQILPVLLCACYDEALRAYPREACGLLFGARGGLAVDGLRRCENDQDRLHGLDPIGFPLDGRFAFRLRFADVAWLIASLDSDRPAQVLFHSHCDVGAAWSAEDEQQARAAGSLHLAIDQLVIDVTAGRIRGARRYRFCDGRFLRVGVYDPDGRFQPSEASD